MATHAQTFDSIYQRGLWGGGSGAGSSEATSRDYRTFLKVFLTVNRIKSVLDLGCGDWEIARHMDWTGIDYTGVDVSKVVLEKTREFEKPGVRFLCANAVTDDLPSADLLIAKDVFQHWPNGDILAFLPRLKNYRAALITNGFHPNALARRNQDIAVGDYRAVELSKPPFNLNGWYVYDFEADETKWVFLWSNPTSPD